MMKSQPKFEPCDKYERLLEQKVKKFFCGQLRDSCYEKVLNLDASYAYSDEPIPFSEVSRLTFQPIRKGEIWAKKNFACAWFRLSGSIPAEMDRRNLYLEFSDDGEALLVNSNGSALKGFTAGSVVFGILDSSIEKRYYQLEDVLTTDGCFELYLDAASNSLLGEFNQGAARLNAACVVRRNPQIQDVYWDFDTLLDYLDAIGDNDPNRNRILYGLRAAQNLIVYKDPEWYSKTKKILTGLFELPGCENIQVTAVGHVNFKKIASIVLAVTLVLSIIAPVPAAAAELKQAAEAELSVEQKLEEQKPEEQQPEEQKPEEQKPEEQKPEEEKPEEQKPEEEKPEEQKPEEEKPEEQKPEEQQPEEEKPEEQQPETEEPKRIEAGAMQADAERNALDENGGFYFTMDKNDIPLNEDVDENGNSLAWKGIKKIYFENLAILAAKAREKGIPFQLTILSAGHRSGSDTYVTPTAEQLRWQMDIGLTFGANNLAHYIYTSHEDSYSAMVDYNTGATTELYNDVMQVDKEHMAWADIYAKYEWQGVAKVDADAENPMLSSIDQYVVGVDSQGISTIDTNGDLLVGMFRYGEQNAYMVTNVGSASRKSSDLLGTSAFYEFATADATATINLKAGGYKQVKAIIRGVETIIDIGDDDSFQLDIPANEGVFIIPIASDSSELGGAVAGAGAVDQNNYTAESARAFNEACDAAQKVLKDTNANQNAIDAALKALDNARNGLVAAGDSTALSEKIAQAAEKKLSYEEASMRDIEAAIAKAQGVIDVRGSDAEIAAAMQELEQALANGEKKLVQDDPDKEDGLTPTGEAESYTRTGSILVTDGESLTEDKLHFSVAENFSQEEEVLQFAPVEENCIRLIRDGKVYSIGIPEKKSLVVSGANAYLSLMNLQLIEIMPLRDGDVLVISGDFLCADEKLAVTIPEAFLLIQGDRSVKESAESNVIQALLPLLTGSGE